MKAIVNIITVSCLLVFGSCLLNAQPVEVNLDGVDFSCTAKHPRLICSDADFKQIRKAVNSCRSVALMRMHNTYMAYADECVEKDEKIEYTPNSSGKILNVSRDVLGQIGACAYAYRFTKDPKYVARVENILNDVCDFETWHPEHYLDVSEMSLAVALGYDWCYSKLKPATRAKCEKAITAFSFETAKIKKWRKKFRNGTNWGQVLNTGLITSAIAFHDTDPQGAQALIHRAIKDNADYIARNYAPDGINPEGPGYWGYGTSMQIILNAALENSFGTDFGLSNCPGFASSAKFITFATGTSGEVFNYSDGSIKKSQPALWYFADKFKEPGFAYNEVKFIEDNPKFKMTMRFGFIYLFYASRLDLSKLQAPADLIFSGQGSNPLVMARTGWNPDDLYVGAKGGGAKNNHAHLDAGSFVFDAYGKRWICEPDAPKYAKTEKALRTIDKSLWSMNQESMRWKVFGYNNLQHNTITINGKDHLVSGKGEMETVYDAPQRKGARFNLSSLFDGQADSVSRSICIVDENSLEILDFYQALPDKDAEVYCNFTTPAQVLQTDSGIIMQIGEDKMLFTTDKDSVKYVIGMNVPSDVPSCLEPFYAKPRTKFFGLRILIPAGESVSIKMLIKKV